MATDAKFDPYYKWLGISPKDRPLTYYRLLGLERFESDEELIGTAVARQRASLAALVSEEYAGVAAKLLKQIESAGEVLRDPRRRAAYDAKLKVQLYEQAIESEGIASREGNADGLPAEDIELFATPSAGARASAPLKQPKSAPPKMPPTAPAPAFPGPDPAASSGALRSNDVRAKAAQRKRKQQQMSIVQIVCGLAALVLLGAIGAYALTKQQEPAVAERDETAQQDGATLPGVSRGAPDEARADEEVPAKEEVAEADAPPNEGAAPTNSMVDPEQDGAPLDDEGVTEAATPPESGDGPAAVPPGEAVEQPTGLVDGAGVDEAAEAIFKAGMAALDDGRFEDATGFFTDYLQRETALNKIKAQLLIDEIENSRSDRYTIEWLLTVPDESWEALDNGSTRTLQTPPRPDFAHDILDTEFEASVIRNIPRTLELWRKIKAGEKKEPYLAAIERLPDGATELPDPLPPGAIEAGMNPGEEEVAVAEPEPAPPAEPEVIGDDPAAYLTAKGLHLDGSYWVLPGEDEIEAQWDLVNAARGNVLRAEKKIDERLLQRIAGIRGYIARGEAALAHLDARIKAQGGKGVGEQVKRRGSMALELGAANAQLAKEEAKLMEPQAAIAAAQVEYVAAIDAAIAFLDALTLEYTQIQENPSVVQAVEQLEQRLGPTSKVETNLERLTKLREQVAPAAEAAGAGGEGAGL